MFAWNIGAESCKFTRLLDLASMFLNKLDFSNVWLSKLRKKSINRLFLIAQARSKDCALWACSGRILGIFLACLGILGRTWACVLVRDWQNASKCGHNGQKVVPKCGLKHAQVWARFGELGCTCHAWAGVLLTADRSFIDKTHVLWVFNYRELFLLHRFLGVVPLSGAAKIGGIT